MKYIKIKEQAILKAMGCKGCYERGATSMILGRLHHAITIYDFNGGYRTNWEMCSRTLRMSDDIS